MNAGVPRAADPPLGAKVLNQRLFQRSARLDEQAPIDGFVRHAQALIVGILIVSQPEICLGDQSKISLLATIFRSWSCLAKRQSLGRKADSQAC